MWVDYPWAYSYEEQSWVALVPVNNQLWIWHSTDGSWEKMSKESPWLNPLGNLRFDSMEALEAWATVTAYGGYHLEAFDYKGVDVVVLRRGFTWGAQTMDISLFAGAPVSELVEDDALTRVFYKDGIYGGYLEYTVVDDAILFTTSDKKEAFSVNLDFLIRGNYWRR